MSAKSSPIKTPRKPASSPKKSLVNALLHLEAGQHSDLLYSILDRMEEEVMLIDSEARIRYVNEATARGLGYTKRTILRKTVLDFMKDDSTLASWQKKVYRHIRAAKEPVHYTIERVAKGKKTETIRIATHYLSIDGSGYILSIARDITEKQILREKLEETENTHRQLSEQSAEGIFTLDLNGNVLYINQAASDIIRATPAQIVGTHFARYTADQESLAKAWSAFRKVKGGEPVIREESLIKDKQDNVVPVEFTASPITHNGKVTRIHTIIRDITRRKRLEELERENEKTQAIQSFVAGTTFEIQHPLKGLLDKTEKLIRTYEDRNFEYIGYKEFQDILQNLSVMRDQIQYCWETSHRLTVLNKRRAGIHHDTADFNAVIRKAVGLIRAHAQVHGIQILQRLSAHLPLAAIDAVDMERIVSNILHNAVQSIHGGGKIQLRSTYRKKEGFVCLECRDTGVGIPKENLKRVFEPFFTTKFRGLQKSSGLGLAIVYSLVKKHKGHVELKSDLRYGTFVRVCLPVSRRKKVS